MFPLWLKLAYTLGASVILVIYWFKYGPGNYLWFSDIALIVAIPALWLESSLMASMMAVGVLIPELVWNFSFFSRLLLRQRVTGMTDYMFERERPLYLKALSLFHVPLPILLLWMIYRLGYATEAWLGMTLLAWVILPLSYWLTEPFKNVNWVRGWGGEGAVQKHLPPLGHLAFLMLGFPILVYLPTHWLLSQLFT